MTHILCCLLKLDAIVELCHAKIGVATRTLFCEWDIWLGIYDKEKVSELKQLERTSRDLEVP